MKKYTDVILDTAGNALNLATVTVVAYPGGGAVTIYSDDGTTVVASSIVTTNSLGEFSFYAPPGRYNLQVRVSGALVNTITDVQFDEGVSEEVATIAAMKALKGMTDGQICYVTSYYVSAIPDGGGGQFKWDSTSSATANDGTIIAPDAGGVGRWRRVGNATVATAKQFGVKFDDSTDNTVAFVKAVAALDTLIIDAGTARGTLSVRKTGFSIIGQGSSVSIIKHPPSTLTNVLELGDTASGNSAAEYQKITVRGVTLDGNRANLSAPGDDLVGHGLTATKISYFHFSDVRAVNCHNAGVGIFINSNYGYADVYIENAGNATYTGPGFDINSSKYGNFTVVSKDSYVGGRVLDNCYGNVVNASVKNSTSHGFVYNNQTVNQSHENTINVMVDTAGGHGFVLGANSRHSHITASVSDAVDAGMSVTAGTITTNTFDGSSAGVVSVANDTIAIAGHGWTATSTRVQYNDGGGTAIGGLSSWQEYYVIVVDANTIKLATSVDNANTNVAVNLTAVGAGATHSLVSDTNPVSNIIALTTRRSGNQGIYMAGNDNQYTINSYMDGRTGAVGASFAIDVNGSRNKINAKIIDSADWKVRGLVFRNGANDNELISYDAVNTLDPYNDGGGGLRNRFNRSAGCGADVVSTAGAIDLPLNGTVFNLTGVSSVTSINAASIHAGRTVTFITPSTAGFTDGNNLKLNGNFAGTADDTITLTSDGTNFYEISRSAN